MTAFLLSAAFFGTVVAMSFWVSAYSGMAIKLVHYVRHSKRVRQSKELMEQANEFLTTAITRCIVGGVALFWVAIEFGLSMNDTGRVFGSFLFSETVAGNVHTTMFIGAIVAVIVMGVTGFRDYMTLEVLRYGSKRTSKVVRGKR